MDTAECRAMMKRASLHDRRERTLHERYRRIPYLSADLVVAVGMRLAGLVGQLGPVWRGPVVT